MTTETDFGYPCVGGPKHGKIVCHSGTWFELVFGNTRDIWNKPATRSRSVGERLFSLPWRPLTKTEPIPLPPLPTVTTRYLLRVFYFRSEVRPFWIYESMPEEEVMWMIKDSWAMSEYLATGEIRGAA